jgi:hypothetical protein
MQKIDKDKFIWKPYKIGEQGAVVVEKPDYCQKRKVDEKCNIIWNGSRKRANKFPVLIKIFYCKTHKCYTTVYPPGFSPYKRKPWIDTSLSGEGSIVERNNSQTMFQASDDAANMIYWKPDYHELTNEEKTVEPGIFTTQVQHVNLALKLFRFITKANGRPSEKSS